MVTAFEKVHMSSRITTPTESRQVWKVPSHKLCGEWDPEEALSFSVFTLTLALHSFIHSPSSQREFSRRKPKVPAVGWKVFHLLYIQQLEVRYATGLGFQHGFIKSQLGTLPIDVTVHSITWRLRWWCYQKWAQKPEDTSLAEIIYHLLPTHPDRRWPHIRVVVGLGRFSHLPLLLVHLLQNDCHLLDIFHRLYPASSTHYPSGSIHMVLCYRAFRKFLYIDKREGRRKNKKGLLMVASTDCSCWFPVPTGKEKFPHMTMRIRSSHCTMCWWHPG